MRIRVRSREPFPAWSFANYIGGTSENYSKLLQIYRVIKALERGVEDSQLYVGTYSADLYPAEQIKSPGQFVRLAEKGDDANEFWHHVRRLRRPIIFIRDRGDHPLVKMNDTEGLRIVDAKTQSPFEINFEGLDKVLRQLFYGRQDERRRQELHDLEVEGRRIELARQKAIAMHEVLPLIREVQNSQISYPIQEAIISTVQEVSDRQLTLDNRATIEDVANDNEDG